MSPVLKEKSEVITFPYLFFQPKIGDIIVFNNIVPPFIFCKKITKIIGDRIWVEGVNRKVSIDSRNFGFIDKKNIIGKVIIKF